jgi:hypothetical protein
MIAKGLRSAKSRNIVTWVLWLFAGVGSARVMYLEYHWFASAPPNGPASHFGGDFWGFLHAARMIAAGRSPYNFALVHKGYGYVYSPLVALALLPFRNAATAHVWYAWTALMVSAFVLFGGLVMVAETSNFNSWKRPLFFGFTVLTIFHFGPVVSDLQNGQTDAFVLVLLATSVLFSQRGRSGMHGVFLALGAVIKTWPVGAGFAILRRGVPGRRRALIAFGATLMIAPLLAIAIGGTSGFVDFLKITFDARSQQQISYSVWGIPRLLFSSSGLARPLIVSLPLRDGLTLVLFAWVVGLLVFAIRWNDSLVLSFWNVVGSVVLILPVSHFDYAIYLLPLLWIWCSRVLKAPRLGDSASVIAGVMVLWWLILFRTWGDGPPGLSSLHTALHFFANFVAVSVSVIGDHLTRTNRNIPGDSGYSAADLVRG